MGTGKRPYGGGVHVLEVPVVVIIRIDMDVVEEVVGLINTF